MTEATKAIVDYAEDGNAVEVRNALYNAIQDRIMGHLDAEKQRIAKSMFNTQQEPQQSTETEVVIGAQEGEEV